MDIIVKNSANYLVCEKKVYNPFPEVLFFGNNKISPGVKITQIGERKRSRFVMEEGHYLEYEGVLSLDGIKYCVFKGSWSDDINDELLYRYCFMMPNENYTDFLLISTKNRQAVRDIDCRHVFYCA